MRKLIFTILISLIFISTVSAQELTSSKRKIPDLNGHIFPSLRHFRNSFINTSLEAHLGFGLTSPIRISGLIFDDEELFAFEGQIMFFQAKVRYQQKFNSWLALFISTKMAGRVGTDMSTILADGVNTIVGGDIGWLIRIMQSRKLNLSGTVSVRNLMGNFINVGAYFEDLINDEPNPSLTNKVPAMHLGLGIQGAYAFNSTFGMQFQAEYSYGESFKRGESTSSFSLGVLGDVDFNPKHGVPVGLALGYSLTSAEDIVLEDGGSVNMIAGRIGYTGSDDFELGLQYTYNKLKLKDIDEKATVNAIALILKFYF